MNRILLVEDNASLASSLKDYLSQEGYSVTVAPSLAQAPKMSLAFDLVILDWMLPDGQGIDYLRHLRKQSIWIPVLFLTAKVDLVDKILGLETGANDYMVKPFEPRELLARLRVHLRKNEAPTEVLRGAGLVLDLRAREICFQGTTLETTRKEFDLLTLLLTHPGRVFSREELLNKVWGFENFPTTRTVDTHVLQLRQKTRDDLIETVRGIGYRLKTDSSPARSLQ